VCRSRGKSAEQVAAETETWIETEMRRLAAHRYNGPHAPGPASRMPQAGSPAGHDSTS